MTIRIDIPEARLARFCREHGIRRLEVFGSTLRDDFHEDSDVDVLGEFEPGRTPGLAFFDIEAGLEAIFGRPVLLLTRRSVERDPNYLFRREALREGATLYEAA